MSANAIESRPVNIPLVVVGAVVVVASFAATLLIGQLSSRSAGVAPTATQAVLVAARDVAPRTVLVAADLAIARYTVADVPPASLATAGAAIGLVAQTALRKGQPVLSNQVGKDAGSGVLAAYLPLTPGVVALTVPSNEVQGVAGYVQAGDYIDVVAVVTPRNAPTANVRTGDAVTIRLRRAGGGFGWFEVNGSSVRDDEGELRFLLGTAREVSEREELRWRLRDLDAGYRFADAVAGNAVELREVLSREDEVGTKCMWKRG